MLPQKKSLFICLFISFLAAFLCNKADHICYHGTGFYFCGFVCAIFIHYNVVCSDSEVS